MGLLPDGSDFLKRIIIPDTELGDPKTIQHTRSARRTIFLRPEVLDPPVAEVG